jgi:hypothetical protein
MFTPKFGVLPQILPPPAEKGAGGMAENVKPPDIVVLPANVITCRIRKKRLLYPSNL